MGYCRGVSKYLTSLELRVDGCGHFQMNFFSLDTGITGTRFGLVMVIPGVCIKIADLPPGENYINDDRTHNFKVVI